MSLAPEIRELIWPLARLGEALAVAAADAGLVAHGGEFPEAPGGLSEDPPALRGWISSAAEWIGVEAEPVPLVYEKVPGKLKMLGPALFRLPELPKKQGAEQQGGDDELSEPSFLLAAETRRGRVRLLDPAGGSRWLPQEVVEAALYRVVEARYAKEVDGLLEDTEVPRRRRGRARHEILRQRLGGRPIAWAWILRLPPSAPILAQAREAGLGMIAVKFFCSYIPKMACWMGAWWFLWQGALRGSTDWAWLFAWMLILMTNIPFRLLEPWFGGHFAILTGWLLKRRLLTGALRLEPEEVRHQGTGQLLSRTIESESAENLTLEAGTLILSHSVDVAITAALLWNGAGGPPHAMMLIAWILFVSLWLGRYFRLRERWTTLRLDATHHLVEQMIGHTTRLAQEPPNKRHQEEDMALEAYLEQSRRVDNMDAAITAAVPGGWLVLSVLMLTPAIIQGTATLAELALSVGGTVFITMALSLLAQGLIGVTDAVVVWKKIIGLFLAAARQGVRGMPDMTFSGRRDLDRPLVEASDLMFAYGGRAEPVLKKTRIEIAEGDRVLLEGSSGSGKSTLVSLLLGLRRPSSGLILLDGLDLPTLGQQGWRHRVAAAPQFHENHVFLGTFAFNLLLGREWPPTQQDFVDAEDVCKALGLEELLQRMPGGLLQMVGETGWKLSHGERSRLFIARALLQGAPLLAFDESFAALDPENLERALKVVDERAQTFVVIAHP